MRYETTSHVKLVQKQTLSGILTLTFFSGKNTAKRIDEISYDYINLYKAVFSVITTVDLKSK